MPTPFNGPTSLNLHYQLIDTTPNAIIAGSKLNDFIALQCGGNKAVNGGLGNDVMIAAQARFVSSGGESITLFLDGRASGLSCSTVTDCSWDSARRRFGFGKRTSVAPKKRCSMVGLQATTT